MTPVLNTAGEPPPLRGPLSMFSIAARFPGRFIPRWTTIHLSDIIFLPFGANLTRAGDRLFKVDDDHAGLNDAARLATRQQG